MKILLSHSGKQHSYQVAKALNDLDVLEKFYTSSYIKSPFLQGKLKNHTFFNRRFEEGLYGDIINSNWRFEIPEFISKKIYGNTWETQLKVYQRDIKFDSFVSKEIKKLKANFFWGFQGSCYQSLKTANENNYYTVCELATAHVVAAKKILGEEKKLHKEWSSSIDNLKFPSSYEKRLEEEPIHAKKIIAASQFTHQTLVESGIPENKIYTIPLGANIHYIKYQENKTTIQSNKLKLLYCGVISQRKGIKYLLEAMKSFNKKDVELHIIGRMQGTSDPLKPYKDLFIWHPPMSQQELFQKYCEFDALVLPTIFEGFGLVIVEAMAAGLPVITTPHSIGPDIIINDKNGYIIPIRNVKAIQNSIQKILNKTPIEKLAMNQEARKAALNYSWENYAKNLSVFLTHIKKNSSFHVNQKT